MCENYKMLVVFLPFDFRMVGYTEVNKYNLRTGFKCSWVFSSNAILIFPLFTKVNLSTTLNSKLLELDLYCISLGSEHTAEHSVGPFQNLLANWQVDPWNAAGAKSDHRL